MMSHFEARVSARMDQGWFKLWVALVRLGFPPSEARRMSYVDGRAFLREAARQTKAAYDATRDDD